MTFSRKMLWGAALAGIGNRRRDFLYPARTLPGPRRSVSRWTRSPTTSMPSSRLTEIRIPGMSWNACKRKGSSWPRKTGKSRPCPCRPNFYESGRHLEKKGIGIQYRLISLWPINKRNVAATPLPKIALGTIVTQPNRPFTGVTKVGNTRYYEAVYPDLAVTQACIGCHNAHPDSPKRDFKVNDVMVRS